MRTVRRIYFYLVSFISLQVVLWGSINLLYSFVHIKESIDFGDILAQGLAQIIVGIPIFLFHWFMVRRDVKSDPEERDSSIRALFFYAIRLTSLVLAVITLYSLLQNLLFNWIGISTVQRMFFTDNDNIKNLITIAANLLVWFLFERLLQKAWIPEDAQQDFNQLKEFRRLFEYLWASFNLLFLVVGLSNILMYVFDIQRGLMHHSMVNFANGLAMVVVSGPLWLLSERHVLEGLKHKENEQSIIRKIFTYVTLFIVIAACLISLGYVLKGLFLVFFGEIKTWSEFINSRQTELAITSVCLPLWGYFYTKLKQVFANEQTEEKRARLTRIYAYVLSLAGSALTYAGGWFLFQVIATLISRSTINSWQDDLSRGLMLLLLGLPLWLRHWQPMQKLIKSSEENGTNNRRSLIRKIYLYLIVFASVIGVMALAAAFVYRNLNQLFGNFQTDLAFNNLNNIFQILLTTGWLWMHLRQLRRDGRHAAQVLQNRHKNFPVWILEKQSSGTGTSLLELFKKHAPLIPVFNKTLSELSTVEETPAPQLIILSAKDYQEAEGPEKTWLTQYQGKILLLPQTYKNVFWAGLETTQLHKLFKDVIKQSIRFADGEKETSTPANNLWAIVGYVLVGLILVWLVFGLGLSLVMN